MKNTLTALILLLTINISAQKLVNTDRIKINQFHEKDELLQMQKGVLKSLYVDRLAMLVNTLQYLPLTNEFDEDMKVLGIPTQKDNLNAIEEQKQITNDFIFKSFNFQNKIIPYSSKELLVDAIIFYESIIKDLKKI